MIPTDLKVGAKVRCIRDNGRALRNNQIYTVIGYNPDCGYSGETCSVLLDEAKTYHENGDHGWFRDRFVVVSDGDGFDWQPPGDVDLGGAP